MRVVSVNVGLPREVEWEGRTVTTAIFKEPVEGLVMLRALNLDGDRQADLEVHGGASKAVYAYPAEHYDYWQRELGGIDLPPGIFGENLTTEGLAENAVHIGDRLRIGGAELVVTEPRMPCFKLGLRFGDAGMVKRFLASRRTGFYLAVRREGMVGAGDPIEIFERDPERVPVAEITRVYATDRDDVPAMRRLAELDALPESWRKYFRREIEKRGRDRPADGLPV